MNSRLLIGTLAALSLLTACGGSSDSNNDTSGQTTLADSAISATFNDADVMFAQMMIPHHEQAVEMAEIPLDPGVAASDAVTSLASRIMQAQDPEIALMKGFLNAWGDQLTPDDGVDHGSMMKGMLSVEELDQLAGLNGAEFDSQWAKAMIAHHEGAVAMANDVLTDGVNPDTQQLAQQIIDTQQTEINELMRIANP